VLDVKGAVARAVKNALERKQAASLTPVVPGGLSLREAIALAVKQAEENPPEPSFASQVAASYNDIAMALNDGTPMTDIAEALGVPLKRLSEALKRAENKAGGLTARGKPRKRPNVPTISERIIAHRQRKEG